MRVSLVVYTYVLFVLLCTYTYICACTEKYLANVCFAHSESEDVLLAILETRMLFHVLLELVFTDQKIGKKDPRNGLTKV